MAPCRSIPHRIARPLRTSLLALGLVAALAPGHAADQPAPVQPDPGKPAAATADRLPGAGLAEVEQRLHESDGTLARLRSDIRALADDTASLNAELVQQGTKTRETEDAMLSLESRLAALAGNEETIRASLLRRRGLLVEVIAALERMGRRPPPALLVSPSDALSAVRTAMLLGAVLPEVRVQAQALADDLDRLVAVRRDIVTQRDALKTTLVTLAQERERIDLLMATRQRTLATDRESYEAERRHADDLARQAASLRELVAGVSRPATPPPAAGPLQTRPTLAAMQDPGRMAPATPFEATRGRLLLPAAGPELHHFGDDDGAGGQEKGLTIQPPSGAVVSTPCDGWVVYAGPFRSYGQLLIIDAGGGYHVVLSGMDRIGVGLGQFVLAGEPVARMGRAETRLQTSPPAGAPGAGGGQTAVTQVMAAQAGSEGNSLVRISATPATVGTGAGAATTDVATITLPLSLHVEFRRNGTSIDPTPWWAQQGEKARG